jgi:hypothetical protein
MKKLFHILTVREHWKLVAEPDHQWNKDRYSGKYNAGQMRLPPAPPFPIGTYYLLEARQYEVRRIVKTTESGAGNKLFFYWDEPYQLMEGHSGWMEKCIAKYDDREEAMAHLRRLVIKQ